MGTSVTFKRGVKAIDLFCGVGGLTCGLQEAGIRVVAGFDNDSSCRFAFSENNNSQFIETDVRSIDAERLNKIWGPANVRILAGCAPCQTFSQHTKKMKNREKDERWGLLYSFLRLVKETSPDIVTMENVPQLRSQKVFLDFVKGLKTAGYTVSHKVVYCPRYGLPQRRSRLVLLASKYGDISLIPETHEPSNYVGVRDAIGDLEQINDGEINPRDPLHRTWKLSPINKKRMIQSRPGGSWKEWDEELQLACHKKTSGSTYKSVYGRMDWNKPAPTITTQFYNFGTGRFGHPEQNRSLSLREGALLQTFPEDYAFFSKGEEFFIRVIGKHIGNAVPVKLGEIIGKSIIVHLEKNGVRRCLKQKK